jgi:hypothetical protein
MMKIRIVSSKEDINDLTRNDQTIHLAFRASSTDMFKLLQSSPRLRAVQVPPSYYKNMPNTGRAFLETQGVEIIEGDVWGHRKDIDEYYVINDKIIERINDLQSEGLNAEEISSRISWESKLSPAMVNYIIKRST